MWRYVLPVIGFLVLAGFFFVGLGRDPAALPSPLIGKAVPAFTLPSVEDPERMVSSDAYRGRMWVLNIWGTWCPECYYEHPVLMEIARRGDVPIVGLDWKDQREPAQEWLKKLGNPYHANAYDEDGRVGIDWGAYGAPETFLIGADGIVLHKHIGQITLEIWERDFEPHIQAAKKDHAPGRTS